MNFNPNKVFRWLSILLIASTVLVSVLNYFAPQKMVMHTGQMYSEYNNYDIFRYSFNHLIEHKNLYTLYDEGHSDLYKYSPTFALFMGLFAFLPTLLGLILWNLLNLTVLLSAIRKLPIDKFKKNALILAFIFIELITSIQNSQSNALLLGLILWAFIFLEQKKIIYASLLILLSVFIKLFGLVAFVMFIFYPQKGKAIISSVIWTVLLISLPILVISLPELVQHYDNWIELLRNDQSVSLNLSVSGWLRTWFGIIDVNLIVLIIGAIALLLPLTRVSKYSSIAFRYLFLASILIWMVIFNHKAESPTYIIAITGVAIWFFTQERSKLNILLFSLTFIFTILSSTDIFPMSIRDSFINTYVIKAVPVIFVWIKVNFDLWNTSS
jgi:hypothetical protein